MYFSLLHSLFWYPHSQLQSSYLWSNTFIKGLQKNLNLVDNNIVNRHHLSFVWAFHGLLLRLKLLPRLRSDSSYVFLTLCKPYFSSFPWKKFSFSRRNNSSKVFLDIYNIFLSAWLVFVFLISKLSSILLKYAQTFWNWRPT